MWWPMDSRGSSTLISTIPVLGQEGLRLRLNSTQRIFCIDFEFTDTGDSESDDKQRIEKVQDEDYEVKCGKRAAIFDRFSGWTPGLRSDM